MCIFFPENTNKAGRGCLDQPSRKDYLHLSSKAEVACLCRASVGFPLLLHGIVPERSKGCSQMCPLTSRRDWAAARPLSLGRPGCHEYLSVPQVLQFRTLLVLSYQVWELSDDLGI